MTPYGGVPVQIAICDDQKLYRDDILKRLQDAFVEDCVRYECFSSGEEVLCSSVKFDFLFLDIEMDSIDGIQVKEILGKQGDKTKIIFLTSHQERMVEAFGENVIGFLAKPVQETALDGVVKKMRQVMRRKLVVWEDAGKTYVVPAEEIRYIEAQDKYTCVVGNDKKYLVRKSMKEWEDLLTERQFCRVNRSYLVNLELFDKARGELVLGEGKKVALSRKHKGKIMEQYKRYLREKAEGL